MLNLRAGRVDIKVVEYEEVLTVSHMVIYRTNSGKPGFHQAETINEAIAYVERLRNAEGVETARIYRLEQVDFSFEPVYKVRVDDADMAGYDQMPSTSSMAGTGGGAMAGTGAMSGGSMAGRGGVDPREPIRIADEPPIADPMGTIPGNPPPLQGPVAPPTGPPVNDPIVAGGQMPEDPDEDSEARRGLFGR